MKKKVFKGIIFFLVIGFLGLYFAYNNGYYEKKQQDKITLTNEMIEKFEDDIKEGKDVTIESYFEEEPDYSTKASRFSLEISNKASSFVDSAIKFVFNKLGNVIE